MLRAVSICAGKVSLVDTKDGRAGLLPPHPVFVETDKESMICSIDKNELEIRVRPLFISSIPGEMFALVFKVVEKGISFNEVITDQFFIYDYQHLNYVSLAKFDNLPHVLSVHPSSGGTAGNEEVSVFLGNINPKIGIMFGNTTVPITQIDLRRGLAKCITPPHVSQVVNVKVVHENKIVDDPVPVSFAYDSFPHGILKSLEYIVPHLVKKHCLDELCNRIEDFINRVRIDIVQHFRRNS